VLVALSSLIQYTHALDLFLTRDTGLEFETACVQLQQYFDSAHLITVDAREVTAELDGDEVRLYQKADKLVIARHGGYQPILTELTEPVSFEGLNDTAVRVTCPKKGEMVVLFSATVF
jgi:hypothetical protein